MAVKKRGNARRTVNRINRFRGLSLHIMPFSEVKDLGISERVKKILNLVLGNKIVVLQGRLRPEEEIRLIEDTMVLVDHLKSFKGIELAVIESNRNAGFFFKMRRNIAKGLIGIDSDAMTVVGPASFVKEIKKDPSKLEVMLG